MSLLKLKIPGRSRRCFKSQQLFSSDAKVVSTVEGEEENPIRKDYYQDCFDESLLHSGVWGHWTLQLKKNTKPLSADQQAMQVFQEALSGTDQRYLMFVAQYLRRKKQLIQRPEIKKQEHLFFEDPKTSEVYGIEKVEIDPGELQALKQKFLDDLNQTTSD